MKQRDLGLDLNVRRTRKQTLLDEMEQVMPWSELLALITPHVPVAKTGRPPFDQAMNAAHSLPAAVVWAV